MASPVPGHFRWHGILSHPSIAWILGQLHNKLAGLHIRDTRIAEIALTLGHFRNHGLYAS